jgi:hypothetical protein
MQALRMRIPSRYSTQRHRINIGLYSRAVLELKLLDRREEELQDEWTSIATVLVLVRAMAPAAPLNWLIGQGLVGLLIDVNDDLEAIYDQEEDILVCRIPKSPFLRFEFDFWNEKDEHWLDSHTKFHSKEDFSRFLGVIGIAAGFSFRTVSRHVFNCDLAIVVTLSHLKNGHTFLMMQNEFGVDARIVGLMYAEGIYYLFGNFARKLSEPDTLMRYGNRIEEFIGKDRLFFYTCLRPPPSSNLHFTVPSPFF